MRRRRLSEQLPQGGRVTHSAEMPPKSDRGAGVTVGLMKIVVIAIGALVVVLIAFVFASNIWLELTRKKRRQRRIEQSRSRTCDPSQR